MNTFNTVDLEYYWESFENLFGIPAHVIYVRLYSYNDEINEWECSSHPLLEVAANEMSVDAMKNFVDRLNESVTRCLYLDIKGALACED